MTYKKTKIIKDKIKILRLIFINKIGHTDKNINDKRFKIN